MAGIGAVEEVVDTAVVAIEDNIDSHSPVLEMSIYDAGRF
jgi:hypothetical protein